MSIHDTSQLHTISVGLSGDNGVTPHPVELHKHTGDEAETCYEDKLEKTNSIPKNSLNKVLEKDGSKHRVERIGFSFGEKTQDYSPRKVNIIQ